ncbi:MAG: DUF4157 domain-containing protein, partial [Bacteroidota bacterium]
MKSSEAKTTSSSHHTQQDAHVPFFKKDGEGAFFSEGARDIVSPKAEPFFSPQTIQPKLKIGQPNDKYEKEADAMADKVVNQLAGGNPQAAESNPTSTENNSSTKSPTTVQRKCSECGKEEDVQKMEEEEVSMKEESIQRKSIFESNEDPPENNSIQRKCATCAEKEQVQKMDAPQEESIQQQSDGGESVASPDLQNQLSASKGGGSPLPRDTADSMGSAMGADFSGVKIHTGSDAVQMNQGLGAQAFTHGSDIYFNEGKYDTGSSGGKKLLAHELTHTVQQGGTNSIPNLQKEDDDSAKDVTSVKVAEKGTYDNVEKKITLEDLYIPEFKYNELESIGAIDELPKMGRPETKQTETWDENLKEPVSDIIDNKEAPNNANIELSRRGNIYYFLKSKTDKELFVIGSVNQIAGIAVRPYWNKEGKRERYRMEVDHIREIQLGGADEKLENLWLLEREANGEAGRTINRNIDKWIKLILEKARKKIDKKLPNDRKSAEKNNISIGIQNFKKGENVGTPENHYKEEDMRKGASIDPLEFMPIKEIEDKGL